MIPMDKIYSVYKDMKIYLPKGHVTIKKAVQFLPNFKNPLANYKVEIFFGILEGV
jgi:hypothetical protein